MKSSLFAILLVLGAGSSGCDDGDDDHDGDDGDDGATPDAGSQPDAGDDSPPGTAEFAGASEPERLRAVQAGLGGDLRTGVYVGFLVTQDIFGACLTEVVDGDTLRFSGPCSDPDGRRFEGSMTLSNFTDTPEEPYDPEQVTRVEFDAFSFDLPTAEGPPDLFEVDGWVEVDHPGSRRAGSLRVAEAGVSARSEIELRCDQDQRCTPADGSRIDIAGVGTAIVSGTWVAPDDERAGSGVAIIAGVDTLSVDLSQFAAGEEDGCIAIQIDGRDAGEVCEMER